MRGGDTWTETNYYQAQGLSNPDVEWGGWTTAPGRHDRLLHAVAQARTLTNPLADAPFTTVRVVDKDGNTVWEHNK
jgi:hypothetical protein